MEGVTVHAKTNELGINSGATRTCVLVIFQHHHARSIAEDKAVTLFIPRPAGRLWIIVARRQCTCGSETTDPGGTGSVLRAPGQHEINLTRGNHAGR